MGKISDALAWVDIKNPSSKVEDGAESGTSIGDKAPLQSHSGDDLFGDPEDHPQPEEEKTKWWC